MFDSHCHLNFQVFDDIYNQVIATAKESGVTHLMIPGTDISTSEKAIEITKDYINVHAAVGVHPTKDLENLDIKKTLFRLEELASEEKVKAIGEIGLDYYHFKAPASLQKRFFLEQIKLAVKLDKPIIIHNRHAGVDVSDLISTNWQPSFEKRIVFHCCEPIMAMLRLAIKKQIFIGVDGDVTYDKEKLDFIQKVPIDLLVIETDAPYIIPEPKRTQKVFPNQPKYLYLIAQKVAEIKKVNLETLVRETTKNAQELFQLT
ncbi:hypothetical protein A2715_05945 [Candidatus Woesebacteria bacterium RIFCSPHIGHO2_01_FULL_39_32]|uniref:Hydrolase, TatD family n=2 Tax=Candidatus Woeseibacteriota TaxID=1752722 RepID=A0A0G0SY41_9BACT|nr:MAG: Hydrolase, TatD family [Candidatus Woesebacteria bacterium GW2011_GWA1_39_8]OGM25559.1 MAG: hypothetical protein A2715_05945 [Candidatus Woesebacteria bacterium RIFCSPHIGHO2_01_FULL_39_32]OGM36839.1 MAG: hypothetical protein A3F01_00420 [Candidatus Woesebacteria bacterium RIFCSPHIGHO2_12_FULL_38_11]OGM65090.1 MAG: hypothetical protein A2893_05555 [Candidatus Woesebacteria bacterium RIFCSPLOWO2_01_FULL_39_25]